MRCGPRSLVVPRAFGGAAIAAVALGCGVAACERTPNADMRPRGALHASPATSAIADAAPDAVAAADAGPAEPPDSPTAVAYLSDATLLVIGRRSLLTRAPDGTTKRRRIAEDAMVDYASDARGVVVRTDELVELLATPSLAVLHHGIGTPLTGARSALAVDEGRAVVFQQGDALMRLVVPTEFQGAQPVTVVTVARGARLNVGYDNGAATDGFSGSLYDAKDGALVGRGFGASTYTTYTPVIGVANDVAFVVKGDRVSRLDLLTAKVVRQAQVACGKDRTLGNPTPSPSGDLVLVTCEDDGIILDGATLQVLRRIPSVLPGCDNGPILAGVVLPDNRTLLLGGCGGEARVDLGKAKFICGDEPGLLGAPYEMMGGRPGPRRAPAGRDHLPRCTKEGQATTLGRSGRFRLVYGEHVAVESDGARPIALEDGAYPVMAPDERSFAYQRGESVIVRALPGGELIAEVRLAGP